MLIDTNGEISSRAVNWKNEVNSDMRHLKKEPFGQRSKSQSKRTPAKDPNEHVFTVELAGTETERLHKQMMQEDLNHQILAELQKANNIAQEANMGVHKVMHEQMRVENEHGPDFVAVKGKKAKNPVIYVRRND